MKDKKKKIVLNTKIYSISILVVVVIIPLQHFIFSELGLDITLRWIIGVTVTLAVLSVLIGTLVIDEINKGLKEDAKKNQITSSLEETQNH